MDVGVPTLSCVRGGILVLAREAQLTFLPLVDFHGVLLACTFILKLRLVFY